MESNRLVFDLLIVLSATLLSSQKTLSLHALSLLFKEICLYLVNVLLIYFYSFMMKCRKNH